MSKSIEGQIIERYFSALDSLKLEGKIGGVRPFCEHYGIDRRNLTRSRVEPERKFHLRYLYYLIVDFDISADWLITGRGKMFYPPPGLRPFRA